MAVIVLGAGATRGCSFADSNKHACLPPLDTDFFLQLQRITNPKHQKLITSVNADVVELFGHNHSATMETVFATLEHTIKMLTTTGKGARAFKLDELKEKRNRLVQAIAASLEDSLTWNTDGHSSQESNDCSHHAMLVAKSMLKQDTVISFNYDCLLDFALKRYGDGKWNAHYGYGLNLGPRGSAITGDEYWQPTTRADEADTIKVYKLHGSLHFQLVEGRGRKSRSKMNLKQRPYTRQAGENMRFTILPPESQKAYDTGVFRGLWQGAAHALNKAEQIVLIGYSLPVTDMHATALFRTSVSKKLKSLVVVNPDRTARRRCREVFKRSMQPSTRVVSFDYLSEFVAADPRIWRV
ncbi:MAG: hypothetical protein RIE32_03815 [Phycisphaerales bacterium]